MPTGPTGGVGEPEVEPGATEGGTVDHGPLEPEPVEVGFEGLPRL
ncbi:MAG: hypothetical protein WA484_02365 [Solirubrobacteraceae bacterium]